MQMMDRKVEAHTYFVALCLALMDSILTFSKSAIKIKCIEIEEKAEKKHCKD